MKLEYGIVSDVHTATPELRTQTTPAVLSQVEWEGFVSGCLKVMDLKVVTTSFMPMSTAKSVLPRLCESAVRGTEEAH